MAPDQLDGRERILYPWRCLCVCVFLTKTYRSPDCEKVGDYEEDVDCYRKDQQCLWFLVNACYCFLFGSTSVFNKIVETCYLYENIPWVNV